MTAATIIHFRLCKKAEGNGYSKNIMFWWRWCQKNSNDFTEYGSSGFLVKAAGMIKNLSLVFGTGDGWYYFDLAETIYYVGECKEESN